jgi:hypothetical protein
MQITREQYDQMAEEISSASVSVWDNKLLGTQDGIILDDLWPILDKYIKPQEDEHNNNNNEL